MGNNKKKKRENLKPEGICAESSKKGRNS